MTSLGPRGFQNLPCCTLPGFRNHFAGSNLVQHNGRRFDHFRPNRGFPAYGYPLYGPYYGYVPLYDSYYDSSQDQAQQYERVVQADVNIHDDRPAAQNSEPPQEASLKQPEPPTPAAEQDPTVLVFRDGHKMEVHNYAIVGQTLFNFDGKGQRKIQLADLDLDSTRKVNDDRGNEFHLPGQ